MRPPRQRDWQQDPVALSIGQPIGHLKYEGADLFKRGYAPNDEELALHASKRLEGNFTKLPRQLRVMVCEVLCTLALVCSSVSGITASIIEERGRVRIRRGSIIEPIVIRGERGQRYRVHFGREVFIEDT